MLRPRGAGVGVGCTHQGNGTEELKVDADLVAKITGILGDGMTFIGSCILAGDLLHGVKKFRDEQLRIKTLKSFAGRVRLETEDGHPIQSESDIHLEVLRNTARWAWTGIALLLFGYLLQLVTRIIELFCKSR